MNVRDSPTIKAAMIALLQQRMDKCTTEQFWTVATLTAADAFLLTKGQELETHFSYSFIILALAFLTGWGMWIIINRHRYYYLNQCDLKSLLRNEKDIPYYLNQLPESTWKGDALSGVVFYLLWVVFGFLMVSIVLHRVSAVGAPLILIALNKSYLDFERMAV
jgi:hypothetical protein